MTPVAPDGQRARIFFALMLGPELGGALLGAALSALGGEREARRAFRLPRPEGLHLTLFFLGDVERSLVDPLWEGMQRDAGELRAPELVIDHAGAFPKPGRERVLWFGVREERHAGRLEELFRCALAAARGVGHDTSAEEHRPFRPHVTVARPRKKPPRVPEAFHALAPELPWSPRALALVESVRADRGPAHYRPIRELPLDP